MRQDPLKWDARFLLERKENLKVFVMYGSNDKLKSFLKKEVFDFCVLQSVGEKSFLDNPSSYLERDLFSDAAGFKGMSILESPSVAFFSFLKDWLKSPSDGRFFILDMENVPGNFWITHPKVLVLPCYPLDRKSMDFLVKKKIFQAQLNISGDGLALLTERVSEDFLHHVVAQLQLLIEDKNFSGKDEKIQNLGLRGNTNGKTTQIIDENTISKILSQHKDYHIQEQIFSWLEFLKGNLDFLRYLDIEQFMLVIRFLGRIFSQLWQFKQCLDRGFSREEAQKQVDPKIFFKHLPWITRYSTIFSASTILSILEKSFQAEKIGKLQGLSLGIVKILEIFQDMGRVLSQKR